MNRTLIIVLCALMAMLTAGCSKSDDNGLPVDDDTAKIRIAAFAVEDNADLWHTAGEFALENIAEAQNGLAKKMELDIRWYDADKDNFVYLAEDAVTDTTIDVIIAPGKSNYAEELLKICTNYQKTTKKKAKPVLLPTTTSVELFRHYQNTDFAWFLSESDMAQCEMMFLKAKLMGKNVVSMISTDDTYGQSFSDWAPFISKEREFELKDNEKLFDEEFDSRICDFVKPMIENVKGSDNFALLVASSNPDVYRVIDSLNVALNGADDPCLIIASDVASSHSLQGKLKKTTGMTLSATEQSGFNEIFNEQYGYYPLCGEGHVYDAVLMAYYAAYAHRTLAQPGNTINETLTKLLTDTLGTATDWDTQGIASALSSLSAGKTVNVGGCGGDWHFDKDNSSVRSSTYLCWKQEKGNLKLTEYFDTKTKSIRNTDTGSVIDWNSQNDQQFDDNTKDAKDYLPTDKKWALLVAGSEGWKNYRHQADVLQMYELLLERGFDKDHIILIMKDDIAYNENNFMQGNVHNTKDCRNLYNDSIDYYPLDSITPNRLGDILMGNKSEDLRKVIEADKDDNIFIFWSGHGTLQHELNWGDKAVIQPAQMNEWLTMMEEGRGYNKIFFTVEACYSGGFASECGYHNGVLFMTAANATEVSHVDYNQYDQITNQYVANQFSRCLYSALKKNPATTLSDLYKTVFTNVRMSHVTIYGQETYGSLKKHTMQDFM